MVARVDTDKKCRVNQVPSRRIQHFLVDGGSTPLDPPYADPGQGLALGHHLLDLIPPSRSRVFTRRINRFPRTKNKCRVRTAHAFHPWSKIPTCDALLGTSLRGARSATRQSRCGVDHDKNEIASHALAMTTVGRMGTHFVPTGSPIQNSRKNSTVRGEIRASARKFISTVYENRRRDHPPRVRRSAMPARYPVAQDRDSRRELHRASYRCRLNSQYARRIFAGREWRRVHRAHFDRTLCGRACEQVEKGNMKLYRSVAITPLFRRKK